MLLGLREKKREQGKTEDYAVFEMEAARRKYMLLLKRYAEERKYRE